MVKIKIALFIVMFCVFTITYSQPTNLIQTNAAYRASVKESNQNKLINIKKIIPTLVLDLRYNTTNNFTKTKLYEKASTTYLRLDAATALQKINDSLLKLKLRIKVIDAYRPYSSTKYMWDLIKDERYVANPKNGSNHNRGLAIDLTLVYFNKQELNMGTGFDNFTDTAHHSFAALPLEVLQNRKLLKNLMEYYGFKSFDTEWWHYTYSTKQVFSIIDLSFKKLKNLVK
jgi:D-alanyl-D-alanine dipeptidase